MRQKSFFRQRWPNLLTSVVLISITVTVGWVIWSEMDRWYSTTHVENMVGKVWEIRLTDSTLEIDMFFTETSTVFAYDGVLPGYVAEGQYVRALFQFSPDNACIIEFIGPAEEPSVPRPYLWMFAILGIVVVAFVIIRILTREKGERK